MTPETQPVGVGSGLGLGASTEPGPDDPGDERDAALARAKAAASTEPGPDDPGDVRPVGGRAACRVASTEPGPDDPGDKREYQRRRRLKALQRSRGRMTPETTTTRSSARPSSSSASTEPGPDDPGDAEYHGTTPRYLLYGASTEPGPDDPGDTKGKRWVGTFDTQLQRSRGRMTPETVSRDRRRGHDDLDGASTEPGPDDPGDTVLRLGKGPVQPRPLQRSRGRMTPETPARHGSRGPAGGLLQRSRGRMTPETPHPRSWMTQSKLKLQRSRGRMTPETPARRGGAADALRSFNGAGAG